MSPSVKQNLADELGDIITYADLLAQHFNIDLGDAVRDKFNEVSKKKGFKIQL